MNPSILALAAAAALLAAVAAASAWWAFVFRWRLPLERRLREAEAELASVRALAARLIDAQTLARRPSQALADSAARALEALQALHPDLALAAVARRPDGSAVLLAHRGGAWARVPLPALRLDAGFLQRAARDGESAWTLGGVETDHDPLSNALAGLGFSAAAAHGWDEEGGGALIAAQSQPGPALARARKDLALAAAALRSAAALAEGIARLSETRERLQGGLSAAMAELTQTHDRLIRKSREVKTLHDVAQAMVTRVGRDISSLGAIVAIVARALDADLVAFLTLDEATGELVTQPGAFGLEGDELLYRIPLTDERSSSVRVFKTRQPFMADDAQNDPGVIASYAQLWKIHSLLVVPLVVEDRVLGVMRVGSRRRGAFGDEALALVTVVAEEASILVETAMLNRRLAETAEQFAALNRMKDEFVSTVSHEFKTPLTTITGFLTVMLDGETGPINEQQMKFLQIAKAAAKRLAGLVSDLLDLSRLEGGAKMELRPLDLLELITQSVENHQPMAAEGGKSLVWTRPDVFSRAVGDQRWLGLVIDNLISNALKFTRSGGKVAVDVRDKGEFLIVSVSDDGIGIPPQDREKIFERFYRASNRAEVNAPGTGLGLAIAREVVAKHGGKIWFDSEVGKGTTFRFVIPASREEAAVS